MLEVLTEQDKLRKFHRAYEREPLSEDELEKFIQKLAVGLYNDGWDEWPENDDEVG